MNKIHRKVVSLFSILTLVAVMMATPVGSLLPFFEGVKAYAVDEEDLPTKDKCGKYTDADGKTHTFYFMAEESSYSDSRQLYIDDKTMTGKDFKGIFNDDTGLLKLGDYIYKVKCYDRNDKVAYFNTPFLSGNIYDMASKQDLGKFTDSTTSYIEKGSDGVYSKKTGVQLTSKSNENFSYIIDQTGKIAIEKTLDEVSGYSSNTAVKLLWNDTKLNADAYRVYQKIDGKYQPLKITKKQYYTINDLSPSTKYSFKVEALYSVNGKYISASTSSAISVKTHSSYKKDGWYKSGGSKCYFSKGFKLKNTTFKIKGKTYLFGKNGALLTNGIYTVNGVMYRTNKSGVVYTDTWYQKGKSEKYYYSDSKGVVTSYEFVKIHTYLRDDKMLFVNGEMIIPEDLPGDAVLNFWLKDGGLYRINGIVYNLTTVPTWGVVCVGNYPLFNIDVCDIATGKVVYKMPGGKKWSDGAEIKVNITIKVS